MWGQTRRKHSVLGLPRTLKICGQLEIHSGNLQGELDLVIWQNSNLGMWFWLCWLKNWAIVNLAKYSCILYSIHDKFNILVLNNYFILNIPFWKKIYIFQNIYYLNSYIFSLKIKCFFFLGIFLKLIYSVWNLPWYYGIMSNQHLKK